MNSSHLIPDRNGSHSYRTVWYDVQLDTCGQWPDTLIDCNSIVVGHSSRVTVIINECDTIMNETPAYYICLLKTISLIVRQGQGRRRIVPINSPLRLNFDASHHHQSIWPKRDSGAPRDEQPRVSQREEKQIQLHFIITPDTTSSFGAAAEELLFSLWPSII